MNQPFNFIVGFGTAAIIASECIHPEHNHLHNHIEIEKQIINTRQGVSVYSIERITYFPKSFSVGFPTEGIVLFPIPGILATNT